MRRAAGVMLALLGALPAVAQQLGPVLPPAPAAIEAAPSAAAPMAVRQSEAERLVPPPPPVVAPPSSGPDSTTVEISSEARPPENDTPRFLFRDVTDRSAPRVKTLPERAAGVESLRQSLGNRTTGAAE